MARMSATTPPVYHPLLRKRPAACQTSASSASVPGGSATTVKPPAKATKRRNGASIDHLLVPASLPIDCFDVGGGVQKFQLRHQKEPERLQVWAMRLSHASDDVLKQVEAVLHDGWSVAEDSKECISDMLGLRVETICLRRGRKISRNVNTNRDREHLWLVWQQSIDPAIDGTRIVVGAMIFGLVDPTNGTKRRKTTAAKSKAASVGPVVEAAASSSGEIEIPGASQNSSVESAPVAPEATKSASIDYVAASREKGGNGWLMLQLAEGLCTAMGVTHILSAADLSRCRQGTRPSAVEAHIRWGFEQTTVDVWCLHGLKAYDARHCGVAYMRKVLPRLDGQ